MQSLKLYILKETSNLPTYKEKRERSDMEPCNKDKKDYPKGKG